MVLKVRGALKIRARQIVQEHVKARVEEVFPALLQMGKERLLMLQQPPVALVELVNLGQRKVFSEQIGHGASVKPLAVQAPLAARIDQAVSAKSLEHQIPAGAFASAGKPLCKE